MTGRDRFELRRRVDDVVYIFARAPDTAVYRRQDRPELCIELREGFGWGAWSVDGTQLQGRPWDAPYETQSDDHPPEGLWVSQKAEKSYAYDLVFT